jgi:putative oxidoreductase
MRWSSAQRCRISNAHEDAEMSTTIREGLAGSRWSRGQDFMGKRLALLAIRLLVSANLLYAAIFLKFAGVPGSVALFTRMSDSVHGLVSQPVFRLGSGVFETVVAVLLLIPKTARLGARLTVVWMTAVILSHIFVLGYSWFFVDALMVMVLAVIYVLLTRRHSYWGESESVGTAAGVQTHKK